MIGKKLKELIHQRNIKQIKLAKYLGISPSRLSNYLSDKREPDLEMLAKMARYLGVDLNYFSGVRFTAKKDATFMTDDDPVVGKEHVTYNTEDVWGSVDIPYMSINSKKKAAKTKMVSVSGMFLNGVDNPRENAIMFEVTTGVGGKNFKQGDYLVAVRFSLAEAKAGALIFETGRNGKVFRYIKDANGSYFLSEDSKELKKLSGKEDFESYYIVVWVISHP